MSAAAKLPPRELQRAAGNRGTQRVGDTRAPDNLKAVFRTDANSLVGLKTMQLSAEQSVEHSELLRRQLQRESALIREQIQRRHRWTIDPSSRAMGKWDTTMTLALLFTATITPFEVCVLTPTPLHQMLRDPLSWLNRLVDVVFVVDIVLNFFIAFVEPPVPAFGPQLRGPSPHTTRSPSSTVSSSFSHVWSMPKATRVLKAHCSKPGVIRRRVG